MEEQIKAVILKPNEAVRLRAKKEMTDRDGVERETGEEWLNRTVGSYLPLAYEEVVSTVKAYVLTDKVPIAAFEEGRGGRMCVCFQKALHVRALRTFTDAFKRKRLHGEEWLIYASDAETYIPDVYEEVGRSEGLDGGEVSW